MDLILSTSCEFYYDYITVTSLPLKVSHKEQPSVILFLWAKDLSANVIQSDVHPVYGDKYFTILAVHVWCKSFIMVVKRPDPVLFRPSTTDAMIAAVDSLILSDRHVMK